MRTVLALALCLNAPAAAAAGIAPLTADRAKEIQDRVANGRPIEPAKYVLNVKPLIAVLTPALRLSMAAAEAKRFYKPFALTADYMTPTFSIAAFSYLGGDGRITDPVVNIEHIVVLNGAEAQQPLVTTRDVDTWMNGFGATRTGSSLSAAFPLAALRPGAVAVAITSAGEQRAVISAELLLAVARDEGSTVAEILALEEARDRAAGVAAREAIQRARITMQDPLPLNRQVALQNLVAEAGAEAIPLLVAALRDPAWPVRAVAVDLLGKLGPKAISAVPELEEATRDESRAIQGGARGALERIRGR